MRANGDEGIETLIIPHYPDTELVLKICRNGAGLEIIRKADLELLWWFEQDVGIKKSQRASQNATDRGRESTPRDSEHRKILEKLPASRFFRGDSFVDGGFAYVVGHFLVSVGLTRLTVMAETVGA